MIRTLHNIQKIELYTTTANNRMRACDVRKKTGADVVINGSLYSFGSWKPVCDVKAKGKVLSNDQYSYRGLAWNRADKAFTVALSGDMPEWDNFISCVFLVNGGKVLPISCNPDVRRSAARTAIFGTTDGKTHIWCDKSPMTPESLARAIMFQGNVDWALMLDGGGSTQLSQEGDDYIYSSRRVHNYICFWEGEDEPETPPAPVPDSSYSPVVRPYSLAKDGSKQLSEHFKAREFACKDGSDPFFVSDALVAVLEAVRQHFGSRTSITSGYRTPTHNAREGGKQYSQHQYGLAADIVVKGIGPDAVGAYARSLMPNHGGVGIYNSKGKHFTHIDVRKERADWRG